MPFLTRVTCGRLAASSVALLLVSWPLAASSQSLGALAQSESARRKEQPKAAKVYTNDNLKTDITASIPGASTASAPAETSSAASPSATPPAGDAAAADANASDKKDEAFWKKRMTTAKEQLERAQAFAAALESQINGLTTEFLQRDDPAQRAVVETNRKKAIAEHERVLRDVESGKKAIAAVEDEARKAGVPPGWLR